MAASDRPKHAFCLKCGKDYMWDGSKGRRLADFPSPCCCAGGRAFRASTTWERELIKGRNPEPPPKELPNKTHAHYWKIDNKGWGVCECGETKQFELWITPKANPHDPRPYIRKGEGLVSALGGEGLEALSSAIKVDTEGGEDDP